MSNPMMPWLGGFIAYAYIPRSIRENHTTADGGRPARIDMMMDSNQQAAPMQNVKAAEARSRRHKDFCVDARVRQGGSGWYDADKE